MRRNKKDDIFLLKFWFTYRTIFFNSKIKANVKNHFDTKLGFLSFVVGFLHNQIGWKKLSKHITINIDDWLKLAFDLYDDESIKSVFSKLSLNPVISLENIKEMFNCFDKIINKFINYFSTEQFNLNMTEPQVKSILKTSFGFILYNCIDCKMKYDFEDILSDHEYDQKVIVILNNTKLFGEAKQQIANYCGSKINNLITLLLGISNDLNYDKKLIK